MKVKRKLLKLGIFSFAFLSCAILVANSPLGEADSTFSLVKPAFSQASTVIAWDDFESGNWSGGSGWLDAWHVRGWSGFGDPKITPLEEPHEGSYHLKLNGYKYAERPVDLSGQPNLILQFWAKVSLKGDFAECRVSPDGSNWYAVKAWTRDTGYRLVEVDLSSYDMSSEFYIRFQIEDFGGCLYVDDVKIVRATPVPTPPPSPAVPEINLNPTSGEANSTVAVSGTGFGKGKEVIIYFNNIEVATTTTNTQGNFNTTFSALELAASIYNVDAKDEDDNIARAKFTMIVPTSETPTPTSETPTPTSWWLEPQWLISIIIAGIACIAGIIRLVIALRRGH